MRGYLARKRCQRLKQEMIEAKMDMKYADKVATECLESILGYRLESYKEPEIAAIGNI